MKRIASVMAVISFILLAIAAAVSGSETVITLPEERGTETWTVLSYMNGEGNLEKFIAGDLMEMEMIGSSDNVNIVVQIDLGTNEYYSSPHASWSDTRRYLVEYHPAGGMGSTRLDDPPLGEIDMDDPDSLQDFITWGLTNYPADHYMIALEGHSGGPARGLMEDASSSLGEPFTMDTHEMGAAIRASIDSTIDRPVDIISFDVCWMGMAEAAAEIMDHSRYMVGSFDEIPGAGWPYDRCLSRILEETSLTLEERLGLVVEDYMDHYDPEGGESYASLSVIDLDRFGSDLLPAIRYLAEEMFYTSYSHRDIYDSILALVDKPRLRNDNAWDRYVDLYQMAEVMAFEDRLPSRVKEAAGNVLSTEGGTLLHHAGGANHPPTSRLFGIYFPTIRNDQERYSPLVMSGMTAWDEHAAMVVEELQITAKRINWTHPDPGSAIFEITSSTPGLVSQVNLEVLLDGVSQDHVLTGLGGQYRKTLNLNGATSISYRYTVQGLYSNHITFPPDGYATAMISSESNAPEIWHDDPGFVSMSSTRGGLSFMVRDETGIETSDPEGLARLVYRQEGAESWNTMPLTLISYDRFRGWMTYRGTPSGVSPGSRLEYHMMVSDIYGNQARYPESGNSTATMSQGKRFYLDAYRSSLSSHSKIVEMFSSQGIALEVGSQSEIPDLSDFKGYILIEPSLTISQEETDWIMDFHEGGGEILLLIDPDQGIQEANSRWLLEGIGISTTTEGSVNGFYPSYPNSDLSDTLPGIAGTSEGSLVLSDDLVPVYYTTPPNAAIATGRIGKGRSVVSVSDIFEDDRMELTANIQLFGLITSFLQENEEPMIEYTIEPEGVLIPGQQISVDLTDSSDPDGEIVSFSVSISDNSYMEGAGPVFTHDFEDPGVFTFVLTAYDAEGGESSTSFVVKVNRPPSLDHGISDTTIHSGETVVFDYKGSDPDGDEVFVLWDFGDGYKVQGKTVSHEYNRKGAFTYILTVTDSNSIEVQRTGRINVLNSDPVAVIDRETIMVNSIPGNFTGPSRVTLLAMEGDTIYLPGDLSGDRDREDVLNLTWNMGDGAVHYGLHAIHRYRSSGLFEVELVVTDDYGGRDNATVLVSVENREPVAVFTVRKKGGSKIELDASNSVDDPWDMAGLEYEWDLGNGDKITTEVPYLEYDYPFGGSYNVRLKITDSDGASGEFSREVEVEGLKFTEIMIISLVVLIVLGAAGVTGYLVLRKRLSASGKGFRDLFSANVDTAHEEEEDGFSRPTRVRRDRSNETHPFTTDRSKVSSRPHRFDRR